MSDTIAYPSLSDFPTTGNSYTEYYTLDTAKTYRWNSDTSSYSEVSTNVNIGTLPLPTGASTESTLLSVLQAVQNNRAYQETIFTDNNAGVLTFFIRRTVANQTTGLPETSYLLPDGTPYTPTGTIQVATANKDNELRSITYQANTTNGVHYTSGDYILRTDIFDITSNPASLLSTIWLNITTNNVISITPTASHLTFMTSGADLTATNSKLDTLNAKDFATQTTLNNLYNVENNQTATGTLTSTGAITLSNISKKSSATIFLVPTSVTCTAISEISFDGSTWYSVPFMYLNGGNIGIISVGGNVGGATNYVLNSPTFGAPYFRFRASSFSGTSLAVSIVANTTNSLVTNVNSHYDYSGAACLPSGLGQTSSTASLPVVIANNQSAIPNNISQIGGTALTSESIGPSGHNAIPVTIAGSLAVASTTGTSVNTSGSAVLSTADGSQSLALDLIITSWNGTGSIDFVLQESLDGTNYTDIWHFTRVTGNGTYKMPSMPICGYRKLVWTVNGTVTTATLARHLLAHNNDIVKKRQFFDRTSALLAGTTGAGATYNISGCKIVNAAMLASAVVSGATYQLEVSSDGTNFYKVGTAKQLTTANELLQLDGLTNNTYQYARINCTVGVVTSQTGVYGLITGSN